MCIRDRVRCLRCAFCGLLLQAAVREFCARRLEQLLLDAGALLRYLALSVFWLCVSPARGGSNSCCLRFAAVGRGARRRLEQLLLDAGALLAFRPVFHTQL